MTDREITKTEIIGALVIERDRRSTSRKRRKQLNRIISDQIALDDARRFVHAERGTKPPHPPADSGQRR